MCRSGDFLYCVFPDAGTLEGANAETNRLEWSLVELYNRPTDIQKSLLNNLKLEARHVNTHSHIVVTSDHAIKLLSRDRRSSTNKFRSSREQASRGKRFLYVQCGPTGELMKNARALRKTGLGQLRQMDVMRKEDHLCVL